VFLVPQVNGWLLSLGALAVAGAIGSEIWKVMESKAEVEKFAKMRVEATLVLDGLEGRLENPEDCSARLGGQTLEPGKATLVDLKYVLNPDDDLRLTEVRLDAAIDDDYRTEILDENGLAVELRRYPVRIIGSFMNDAGNGVEIRRPQTFFIWTTPPPPVSDGRIQSCFGPSSAGSICNDLGGYFIPGSKPYEESCRLSYKTLKRVDKVLVPAANCRVNSIVDSPKKCPRYGLHYGAVQLNGYSKVLPAPGNKYLCQICQ
jgi:hypothetical protein